MNLIANRNHFVQDSLPFLTLVEEGKVKLFVSEVSVGTLIYLAFERYKLVDAKKRLIHFMDFFVTRDQSDSTYGKEELPVLSPKEFFRS
jgi:hypothetical protein